MSDPKLLDSREVFRSTKFTVIEERFQLSTGETVSRAKLGHIGAAVIVPQLPDGRLILVEQYRYALKERIFEFPAGTRDAANEDPLTAAKRELKEEIGGESTEWLRLGSAFSTPGFTDELLHAFLAKNVTIGKSSLEIGELAEPHIMTVNKVEEAIKTGKLRDMKSIVAFSQARIFGYL